MTFLPNNTVVCDSCGADLGNGSVMAAAALNVLTVSGQPVTLHLGLACCTLLRETVTAAAWRQTDDASPGPVELYEPVVDQ